MRLRARQLDLTWSRTHEDVDEHVAEDDDEEDDHEDQHDDARGLRLLGVGGPLLALRRRQARGGRDGPSAGCWLDRAGVRERRRRGRAGGGHSGDDARQDAMKRAAADAEQSADVQAADHVTQSPIGPERIEVGWCALQTGQGKLRRRPRDAARRQTRRWSLGYAGS